MKESEDDIDRFLYGDEVDTVKQANTRSVTANAAEPIQLANPNVDNSTFEEEGYEEDEDDEEDEEDIEIVIDSQSKANTVDTNKTASSTNVESTTNRPTINLDAEGQLNGRSILDVDLDGFEERPWRKAGADLTDYFNYGFNEMTWRLYCGKQKAMREGAAMAVPTPPFPHHPPPPMPLPPFMFAPPGMPPPMPMMGMPRGRMDVKSPEERREASRTPPRGRGISESPERKSRRYRSPSPEASHYSKRRRD